jgi:type VI secretion system secreted protein Hcp
MAESMWIKIDGCKGEATDEEHKDEIDIQSFSWGMSHPVSSSGTGQSMGESSASDLSVMKLVDRASPNLMKFCMNAKVFPEVLLTCRKRGETPIDYMKIKMKNALISSVQNSGAAEGGPLSESVSFAFTAVEVEYTPQKDDGSADGAVTMKWDYAKNKEG